MRMRFCLSSGSIGSMKFRRHPADQRVIDMSHMTTSPKHRPQCVGACGVVWLWLLWLWVWVWLWL